MSSLELSTDHQPEQTVITVRGDLDITTRTELDTYVTRAAERSNRLIVDLTQLTFLDTGALGVLARHWKHLSQADGTLILAGVTYRSARALWISGLDKHIPHTDTLEEALAPTPAAGDA